LLLNLLTSLNIYAKLQKIQSEIKELVRTEENKFQRYFFFNELQILQHLKPLLEKHHLTLLLSDDISQPFIHERNNLCTNCSLISDKKEGKEHYVKYLKKLEIVDAENPENKLLFNFWAGGQNVDLAKAKGSAETYAIKYFLAKFFLIPVKDEGDPDYGKDEKAKERINSSGTEWQTLNKSNIDKSLTNSITSELVDNLINLFRQKTADNKERQTKFLTKLDQLLTKQGITGVTETDANSFRNRLSLLTPLNYQELYNWLLKFEDNK
jgi:hypothetical protein